MELPDVPCRIVAIGVIAKITKLIRKVQWQIDTELGRKVTYFKLSTSKDFSLQNLG